MFVFSTDGQVTYPYNYHPCSHSGVPCDDSCSCVESQNFCEKYCLCSVDCKIAFDVLYKRQVRLVKQVVTGFLVAGAVRDSVTLNIVLVI